MKKLKKKTQGLAGKKRAVFLLLSSEDEIEKAVRFWASLKPPLKRVREEIFAVSLDSQGDNFETAMRKALNDGFESFVLIRFLPNAILSRVSKLPEMIEKIRRDFLQVDFHYTTMRIPRGSGVLKNNRIRPKRK